MEKIKLVTNPVECDMYTITMIDEVKCICVKGQLFEDVDHTWVCSKYPFLVMDLKNFMENRKEFDSDFIYAGYLDIDDSRFFNDATDKKAVEFMNIFFNGETADAYLNYSELTIDTPCGNYVSKENVDGNLYTELAEYKF